MNTFCFGVILLVAGIIALVAGIIVLVRISTLQRLSQALSKQVESLRLKLGALSARCEGREQSSRSPRSVRLQPSSQRQPSMYLRRPLLLRQSRLHQSLRRQRLRLRSLHVRRPPPRHPPRRPVPRVRSTGSVSSA